MRMGGSGPSAADLVNEADESKLADIFYYFGEERFARRIAKAIVAERARAPFTTTLQLAEMYRTRGAGKARRHSSCDAQFSGAAHRRQ